MPAAAEANGSSAREAKRFAGGVYDFEVPFDADVSIGVDCDFSCGHLFLSSRKSLRTISRALRAALPFLHRKYSRALRYPLEETVAREFASPEP